MLICYPRYSAVMVPTRSATLGVLVRSDIGQTPEGSDLFQDRRTTFTPLPWFAPKGFRSSQGRPDFIVRSLAPELARHADVASCTVSFAPKRTLIRSSWCRSRRATRLEQNQCPRQTVPVLCYSYGVLL